MEQATLATELQRVRLEADDILRNIRSGVLTVDGVGRLAFKSIVYFEIVTTLALFIGLLAVNFVKPGVGVVLPPRPEGAPVAGEPPTFASVLEHTVPQSFFEAAARNEVLQIVFFAVIFAIALSQVRGRAKETMVGFCEALAEDDRRAGACVASRRSGRWHLLCLRQGSVRRA